MAHAMERAADDLGSRGMIVDVAGWEDRRAVDVRFFAMAGRRAASVRGNNMILWYCAILWCSYYSF